MENDILVIGIAGGTASGKTTLMKNLINEFGGAGKPGGHKTVSFPAVMSAGNVIAYIKAT